MGAKNVLGGELEVCSRSPMTGFFRNGCCDTGSEDMGSHIICCVMTDEFLEFSKMVGNDLSTARPEWDFPGLHAGDRWCVCMNRWLESYEAGCAPKVVLAACHVAVLEFIGLDELKKFAAPAEI